MGEMRRDRLADDEPLELRKQAFFRHGPSNRPTGLADGLEIGSSLPAFALRASARQARRPVGFGAASASSCGFRRDTPLGRGMRPAGSPVSPVFRAI